jgi:hypothetical protein
VVFYSTFFIIQNNYHIRNIRKQVVYAHCSDIPKEILTRQAIGLASLFDLFKLLKEAKNKLKYAAVGFAAVIAMQLSSFDLAAQNEGEKTKANEAADVAKKLANPIASLISVPFQNNLDVGIGQFNGYKNTLNFQPVIPLSLSRNWNLIARVILPIISQADISAEGTKESGLGDAIVSAFFSPALAKNGVVWGAGPCFLVPNATNEMFATKKFGAGPTAVILKQANGWTIGALINQIWSIAGSEDRPDVNQMFLQPFVGFNWKTGAGFVVNSEMTKNWEGETFTAFINPTFNGITKFGKQMVQLQVGPRIQVAAPEGKKAAFGVRASVVLVFPK